MTETGRTILHLLYLSVITLSGLENLEKAVWMQPFWCIDIWARYTWVPKIKFIEVYSRGILTVSYF